MVAQANAQSDHYSGDEDSDDDLEPCSYECENRSAVEYVGLASGPVAHVSAGNYPTQQACGVSGPAGDTPGRGTTAGVTMSGGVTQQLEQCAHVLRTQGSRGSENIDEAAF